MTDEAKGRQTVEVEETVDSVAHPGDAENATVETAPEPEALQEQLDETRDRLMRLAAEFENYKKRMERERSRLLKYAGENILRDLLTTVDNIDRAVEQGNAAADDDSRKLAATGICVVPLSSFATDLQGFRITLLEKDEDDFVEIFQTIAASIRRYIDSNQTCSRCA